MFTWLNLNFELTQFIGAIAVVALGLLLFLFWNRPFKKRPKPLLESEDLYIRLNDGFKIRYRISGNGPPLLLIHGIGANIFTWKWMQPLLLDDFKVLTIDLPGFGKSSKIIDAQYDLDAQTNRLIEFCHLLNLKSIFLVGSSMGGAIALNMARLKPNIFPKVVTLCPASHRSLLPFDPKYFALTKNALARTINKRLMRTICLRVVHNQKLVDEDYINQYLQFYKDQPNSIQTFIKSTKAILDPRLPELFSDVKTPTLTIWGAHDTIVNQKTIQHLHKVLPKDILVIDNESGHHPMEDNPAWISDQIVSFFLES